MTERERLQLNEELCNGLRNTVEAMQTNSQELAQIAMNELERADMATPEDNASIRELVLFITDRCARECRHILR